MLTLIQIIAKQLNTRREYLLAYEAMSIASRIDIKIHRGPTSTAIRASQNGNVVGVVYLNLVDDYLNLHGLYVEPRLRNRGIASTLMYAAKYVAGTRRIILTAKAEDPKDQDKLVWFYKRHGFWEDATKFVWADQDSDQNKLNPDSYRRKYGKCPDGWQYDDESKRCVKVRDRKGDIPGPKLSNDPAKPGPDSPGALRTNKDPGYPGPTKNNTPFKPVNEDSLKNTKPINNKKKRSVNTKTPKTINRKNNLPKVINK